MSAGRVSVVLSAACAVALVACIVAGCANRPASGSASATASARAGAKAAVNDTPGPSSNLWTLSDRGIKTELIRRMKTPPALVVLGGSRALRFQPAYIRRVTGLSAFNAAVPHATPKTNGAS